MDWLAGRVGSACPKGRTRRLCVRWIDRTAGGRGGRTKTNRWTAYTHPNTTPRYEDMATEQQQQEQEHGAPAERAECECCMEDLDGGNYVEYRATADGPWRPSPFCRECVEAMLARQWEDYKTSILKTDCEAEWRRLLKRGPPTNLRDPKAFPCPEDGEVHSLWYMEDGGERPAKLHGSLEGEERDAYWAHLKQFAPSHARHGSEEEAGGGAESEGAAGGGDGAQEGEDKGA